VALTQFSSSSSSITVVSAKVGYHLGDKDLKCSCYRWPQLVVGKYSQHCRLLALLLRAEIPLLMTSAAPRHNVASEV
jgi:hypothetical protein